MSDLTRLKKKRSANRKVVENLLTKGANVIAKEYNEGNVRELEVLINAIEAKQMMIQALDSEILDVIEEASIEADVNSASDYELLVAKELTKLKEFMKKHSRNEEESTKSSLSNYSNVGKGVKLPKISVKKFNGDPVNWQQFIDTFDATIHMNSSLSSVEKFTYLKGYVEGSAEKCIENITLSHENYEHALGLLRERYGNPQLIIATHVSKLLRLNAPTTINGLRNLHDQIESHVRSLLTAGINAEQYGPMIIPVILQKLPEHIGVEISKKLGTEKWDVQQFMKILKAEISARESYDFLRKQSETDYVETSTTRHFTTESLFTASKILKCAFCNRNHHHDRCNVVTDLEKRKEIIYNNRLCYKCLNPGHTVRKCRTRIKCFRCKGNNHHTAICNKNGSNQPRAESSTTGATAMMINTKTSVLLQTATATVSDDKQHRKVNVRILLDSGSQRTYISERIVNELKLKPTNAATMVVNTFGNNSQKEMTLNEYTFRLRTVIKDCDLVLKAFSVPFICSPLSGQQVDVVKEEFSILKELNLGDAGSSGSEIDLLIGADFYWKIIKGEVKRLGHDGLIAVNSKLGWLLSGPYNSSGVESSGVNLTVTHVLQVGIDRIEDELSRKVEKFWDLDSVGVVDKELSVYEKFTSDIKFQDNRYEVHLPFKEDRPLIEDNYVLSLNRLNRLHQKLALTPELLRDYDDIIRNQIQCGVVEKADSVAEVGEVTYLPHRAVIRQDKKSTKLRVVFDASAKGKGRSLNDCLYKGPSLNPLLFDILLRFRIHNIAMTADIEKAYLQIGVAPEDRDYLRFLWYNDLNSKSPQVCKYRFTRVIFGASCSQFLLNGTIHTHVQRYENIDSDFSKKILRHFYVDDLNSGVPDIDSGKELYKKVKLRFAECNFNIRKWRTNSPELRDFIYQNEQEVLNVMNDKVLGITWNEIDDVLIICLQSYINETECLSVTKRNVLKVMAGFYDPIGFIQPLVVKLKILFQRICANSYDWDAIVSDELHDEWFKFITEMKSYPAIIIPRCYCIDTMDKIKCIELHGFSDASESAYGACVYLRYVKFNGVSHVVLVASKSRIAPLKKKLTIPKLELMGILILSKLLESVKFALKDEIEVHNIVCWSDSQVAISWVKAIDKEFTTFVQNRVISIRQLIDISQLYYCQSKENPADLISKINSKISDDTWWNGPRFLHNLDYASSEIINDDSLDFSTELIQTHSNVITSQKEIIRKSIGQIIHVTKYSCLLKLFRVTAYVIRFIKNTKKKIRKQKLNLEKFITTEELNRAKLLWVLENQIELKANKEFNVLTVNLNLQKDKEGVIRSYHRLKNAKVPFDTKAPIMLEKSHKLTELIVSYYHLKVLHRGVKHTLTELRSSFWITRGRSFIKHLLHNCTVCAKLNARPYDYPKHSDLPTIRVEDGNPFKATGIDYLGPLYCTPVYGGPDLTFKAYVVIYTCASSRAVILDVVNNADAKTFINSLSRFIARRGCPSVIISDNGTVFKAIETQNFAASHFIQWRFNLDLAPWWGGMWERLVSSVKACVKKTVSTNRISYIELQTLIFEIEAVLNNRPICNDYDDDLEDVLTPNHLLFGRRLEMSNTDIGHSANSFDIHDININKRRETLVALLNHFWNAWRKEYLTSLRETNTYRKMQRGKIKANDIVIVQEEKQPRHLWRLARIIKLIPSRDNIIRGAVVKIGKTGRCVNRPVNRLYPIEQSKEVTPIHVDSEENNQRPKRNAAVIGEIRRKYCD